MNDFSHAVESYKFRDAVMLWARERLVHEVIVGRELAKGIIRDGLRFQSINPKWLKSSEAFRRYPYIGYVARESDKLVLIRAEALEHLLAADREAVDPELEILSEEFVTKSDFRNWLVRTGMPMPAFWFAANERYVDDDELAKAVRNLISAIQKECDKVLGTPAEDADFEVVEKCRTLSDAIRSGTLRQAVRNFRIREFLGSEWVKAHPSVQPFIDRLEQRIRRNTEV
jgi:hypothetical protein